MTRLRPIVVAVVAIAACLVVLGCADESVAPLHDAGADAASMDAASMDAASMDAASMDAASDLDGGEGEDGAVTVDAALTPDATTMMDATGCTPPTTALHASMGGAHVASNDGVVYNSNPPSSGPHCGTWGQYSVYGPSKPLPRCNYIHNLEHGAVVLLYNCPTGCPEIVSLLTSVRDAAVDPQCLAGKRVIITPDPDLATPIAATAWRNTWTAECLTANTMASLSAFVTNNLGSAGLAPESGVCSAGGVSP